MQQELTPSQSLQLIQQMALQAKQSFQRSNFYFLLWGVVFALAGVVDHFLRGMDVSLHWVVWPVMTVIGGVVSGIRGAREGREQGVTTMMDRLQMWLWTGYMVTLVLLIVAAVSSGRDPNPLVLVLTGFPTFVTGAMIRFKPLMVGGVLFWLIGSVSLFYWQEHSSLVFSAAIVLGYIVPGMLLKRHEDGIRST